MGKWSCACPDGVVNGIDAAFFNCPLTLCYLQFGIPIYRCRLLSFFRLLVSLLSFVPAFLSFCPSFFLSFLFVFWAFPPEPSLVWYLFPSFVLFLSFSFSSSFFYFCVVLCFLCGLCPCLGRVSICCCSLRPRNLYISRPKHRYGIWMYWMAIREERSI